MLETISDIFREAYQRNWITARDGNCSLRYLEQDYFFVTPSGVRKQTLQPEMFKKSSLTGEILDHTPLGNLLKPSGEFPMHLLLQQKITTPTRVVLHLHPTYTVALLRLGYPLDELTREFPELSRYTTVGSVVPKIPPITHQLATACVRALGLEPGGRVEYNIVGMVDHGVVAVDTTPWRCFEHVERLEHCAKILLLSNHARSI